MKKTIKLAISKGLGDAIWLRAVVLHFLKRGEKVMVFSSWPQVFADLSIDVRPLSEAYEPRHTDLRHLSMSHHAPIVDMFARHCENAGIDEPVELRMDWPVRNRALLDHIKHEARGRKIFVYQPLKTPRNEDQEMLRPDREAFHEVIREHGDYFRIRLGHPPYVDEDRNAPCELDLLGKGFIFDTLDVCTIGDLFFGEHCFLIVTAEAMSRNYICMLSARAAKSDGWLRYWTPEKLLHRPQLGTVIYDEGAACLN